MLLIIAWKNIWRNKLRSAIIICAIAVGLFGGLFTSAFMNGMVEERIKIAIENESANIQIHNKKFELNKELNDTILNLRSVEYMLDTMKQIKGWSPRLKITAMAGSAATGAGVMINGIDPEKERKVTGIFKYIPNNAGNWFLEKKKNSIVIGRKLADKLKLKLHSKIILTFQDKDLNLISAAFKVIGIYKTTNTSFDERFVFVKYNELNKVLGFNCKRVHEIAISLNSDNDNKITCSKLQKEFPDLDIMGWKELMPDLGMLADYTIQMLYIILIIILFALCFGIINTMLMAIMERTREIGMLMAIGMNKIKVFWLVMLETVFLSLTGGIAGIFISILFIKLFAFYGLDLSAFAKGFEAIGYGAIIYPALKADFYIGLTALVIITGILSSVIPARKAIRLRPSEAIRNL